MEDNGEYVSTYLATAPILVEDIDYIQIGDTIIGAKQTAYQGKEMLDASINIQCHNDAHNITQAATVHSVITKGFSVTLRYPIRAHVAVDTGMGRFGIRWSDVEQAKAVYSLPGFSFEGIFSHFSCSFEQEYQGTKLQLSRFLSMTEALQAEGVLVGTRHIANSCAALRFPETRLDAVRIGSALVGKLPTSTPVKLESVSIFKAQVVDCKRFQPGDTTGYGSYCRIKKSANAVIVALGREDGFGSTAKPDKLRLQDLAVYLS